MAAEGVYAPTTTSAQHNRSRWFKVPSENLDKRRCCIKVVEVLLSFVAFVLEEVVYNCYSCAPLYFFEFVSCTAFLFTLLLLILLTTTLHQKVGINCWPFLDFVYTVSIMLSFLIASIVFLTDNGGSSEEIGAVSFGFLAILAFLVDVVFFVKSNGVPRPNRNRPSADVPAAPVAESEKLNANGND